MNLEATKPGWEREESGKHESRKKSGDEELKQMLSLSWAPSFQIHPSLLS
jgi:hypothetical protein